MDIPCRGANKHEHDAKCEVSLRTVEDLGEKEHLCVTQPGSGHSVL